MSLVNTISYSNPANFTFDATKIIFGGANAQLSNQRPANSTFYAGFHVNFNGEYGNGVLTATAGGVPTRPGFYSSLIGAGVSLTYPVAGNADFTQTGTIRCLFTPQYNGTPGTSQEIVNISNGVGSTLNLIELNHFTDGQIYFNALDLGGVFIVQKHFAWTPVSGTSYEFEVDFDFNTGTHRIFIDGIQQATATVGPLVGIRSSASTLFTVGRDYNGAGTPNFFITDLIIFNTVQHVANFPSEIPRASETLYSMANPQITVNASQPMSGLTAFTESAVKPANTTIQYYLLINGAATYWNGAAWVASSATFAQSNTAATINTNAATLNMSSGDLVQVVALLSSTLGNATPTLTSVTETYDFFVPTPAQPPETIVYAFMQDIIGAQTYTNAKLNIELPQGCVINGYVIAAFKLSIPFNSVTGYAQAKLIATDVGSELYNFSITYTDSTDTQRTILFGSAIVPTAISAALTTLTSIVTV